MPTVTNEFSVNLINSDDDFAAVRDGWRDLEARSGVTVFQSWDWCWHWWRVNGAGKRLAIATVSKKGRVLGILPLFISRRYLGLPLKIAAILGTGSMDYGGVLVDREADGEKVLGALLGCFDSQKWDVIDLHQLPGDDVLYRHRGELFSRTGYETEEHRQETTFRTLLPGSREDFAASLGKKFRGNIDYNWRRLNREHAVEVDTNCDPGDGLDDLYRLHRKRWRKKNLPGVLYSERVRSFHRLVSTAMFEDNRLMLSFLSVDGVKVAGLHGFKFNGAAYYYLGGFDPEWASRSVSTLLLSRLIDQVIDEGFTVFDFLRGEESYKEKWLAEPRPAYRLIVVRNSTKSDLAKRLLAKENQVVLKAKQALQAKKIKR